MAARKSRMFLGIVRCVLLIIGVKLMRYEGIVRLQTAARHACVSVRRESEHLADALYSLNESVYFIFRVVQGEGGADCALYAKTLH